MTEPNARAACFICRCEELTKDDLEAAVLAGARTINDVKRRTRVGMGLCQGAYCLNHVAAVLHDLKGTEFDSVLPMTARPPVRAITLSALAGTDTE